LSDTLKLSRLALARSAGAKRGNLDLHGGLLYFKGSLQGATVKRGVLEVLTAVLLAAAISTLVGRNWIIGSALLACALASALVWLTRRNVAQISVRYVRQGTEETLSLSVADGEISSVIVTGAFLSASKLVTNPPDIPLLRSGEPESLHVYVQEYPHFASNMTLIGYLEKQPDWTMRISVEFTDHGKRRKQSFTIRAAGAYHNVQCIPGNVTDAT
jgi:hypothetical protein